MCFLPQKNYREESLDNKNERKSKVFQKIESSSALRAPPPRGGQSPFSILRDDRVVDLVLCLLSFFLCPFYPRSKEKIVVAYENLKTKKMSINY